MTANNLAACNIHLCPMDTPVHATSGHECHGVSIVAVMTVIWRVGSSQLTSPKSVLKPGGPTVTLIALPLAARTNFSSTLDDEWAVLVLQHPSTSIVYANPAASAMILIFSR